MKFGGITLALESRPETGAVPAGFLGPVDIQLELYKSF